MRGWAELHSYQVSFDTNSHSQATQLLIRSIVCSYEAGKMRDDIAEKQDGDWKEDLPLLLAFKNCMTLSKSISTVQWR